MPLRNREPNVVDEDRQVLVDNEEPPHVDSTQPLDNNFGDGNDDDAIDEYVPTFTPATLPEPTAGCFQNVELQGADILYPDAPEDRFNLTYLVFYLLGTATMTPWNFFVTAEDYWMYKFRNTTLNDTDIAPELTPMQKSFTCDLTLTASISGTTFLILNAIYGHRVPLKLKMLGTLSMILIIFGVTTTFVEINTDRWQEQFFLITLFTVVIINISSAVMSGGIFGIAGLFPSKYMSAVVSGQALGGIFTAIAFILVLAIGTSPKTTAFIYFIIGSVVIILCIAMYSIMSKQAFFKFYVEGTATKYQVICNSPSSSRNIVNSGVDLEPNIFEVFSKIYVHAVGVCLLFATTLSVYPGVSVLMQSQNFGSGNPWNDIYYMPVVNYLFFNSGDYFGRIFAGLFERPRDNPHTVLLMTIIRMLYIPFFLCSNSNIHQFLPVLVHSDAAFITMVVSFALSNGYLANIFLMTAPRICMHHEKEIASAIMTASLSCGLALGSVLSMVFVQML